MSGEKGVRSYTPLEVASFLEGALRAGVAERGRATLALPGGRTPGPIVAELARLLSPATRSALCLLWVDERALPVGDTERNDRAVMEAWVTGGPLPGRVEAMAAEEADLALACRRYELVLDEVLVAGRIDACLLGIGEDGHFASLFPNHEALTSRQRVLFLEDSPKPPPRRITLSLPLIAGSRALAIVALGAGKGLVHRASKAGANPALPVSLLEDCHPDWFLDEAALRASLGADFTTAT
ncbi:MAG: 6-phosphogluconolactonase [Planctomycetes bacterium]|nr:6-phosphogluconolactonase [Planctomycetota bacterium]